MSSNFSVGDEVTYHPVNRFQGLQAGLTVSKVARKYVTVVMDGRPVQFDKETGAEKEGVYVSRGRIETEQMTAERFAHIDARRRVVDAGFTVRDSRWEDFSTETLNRVADILEKNR